MVRVLYDGWDLVYRPNSPAAIHLLEILASQPQDVQAAIGLPGISFHQLPDAVVLSVVESPNSPSGRLLWEQRTIPGLAKTLKTDLIHTFEAAALFGARSVVLSPASVEKMTVPHDKRIKTRSLASRLRDASGQGGRSRLKGLFWPTDLDRLDSGKMIKPPRLSLPVPILPAFRPESRSSVWGNLSRLDLPATFVLYHDSLDQCCMRDLLAAWSWAVKAIGHDYPLLVVGMDLAEQALLNRMAAENGLEDTVRALPPLSLDELAQVYRASSLVFEPGGTAVWGNSLRLALASGRPVVGLENPLSDLILGPAGYLVALEKQPGERFRALGAALISVIVDEGLAASLAEKALQRSLSYDIMAFSTALKEAYHSLAAT